MNAVALRSILDRWLAVPAFIASVTFLALLGGLLHLHDEHGLTQAAVYCAWGLAALYPLFLAEFAAHVLLKSPNWRSHLLCCVLPPLRLGSRDHATGTKTWLPIVGWATVNDDLRRRVEKGAMWPMIGMALMVLPVLGVSFAWEAQIASNPRLATTIQVAETVIWLAFAFEFFVMIGIVDKKIRYCREHWIDIAIIVLPLVAFLRIARLARLSQLQKLGRTARVYRMRGTAMRLWRALLLLEAFDRMIRGRPEQQLVKLHQQLEIKQQEVADLQERIRQLESKANAAAALRLRDAA